MADSLIVKLGADTSEFRGQVAAAGTAGKAAMDDIGAATTRTQGPLKELKRGFSDLRLLFAGGGMVAVLNFFMDLSELAQKSKDLTDENIDSTRKWGEEWKGLKTSVMDFGIQALGQLARVGRGFGDLYTAIEAGKKSLWAGDGFIAGFRKTWEEIQAGNKAEDETRRGLQQTLQTLEQVKKTSAARKENSREAAEAEKQLLRTLKEEYQDGRKIVDSQKELATLNRKKLSDEEQLLAIAKEEEKIKLEIAKAAKFVAEGGKLTLEGTEQLVGLEKELVSLANDRKEITEKTKQSEAEITKEKIKQLEVEKNRLASIAGIRGKQFNEASDESLQEVVRRNRAQAQRIGTGESGFGIGQDLEKARLLAEAMNAQKELDTRAKYRAMLSGPGGEAAARRSFQGDPLQFETFISQIQNREGSQPDKTQLRIATGIEETNRRLQMNGFNLN